MSSEASQPSREVADLVHHLPHRIRLTFRQPVAAPQLHLIRHQFQLALPHVSVRVVGMGSGLVLHSYNPVLQLHIPQIYYLLQEAFEAGPLHTVSSPPTVLQRSLERAREGSIQLFMALAILGWVLPILPGTPFFLIAWWLGWRPPAKV
jgi:hypothetical protein